MKILVCLKQVPDKDSAFRVNADGDWIETSDLSFQINDYDRYALEEALRIRDGGGAEVTVISIGPARVGTALKTALAMGADRAIHVNDPAAEGSDALGTARILCAAASGEGFDLIFTGFQSDDDNLALVGPFLARLLGVPCATGIVGLELLEGGGAVRAKRELESNRLQVVDLDLPALVTVQTGINHPRYASLKGIMAAKRKETRAVTLAELQVPPERAGRAGARVRIVGMAPPPKGEGGEILQGSTANVVADLVRRIHEKTGVF